MFTVWAPKAKTMAVAIDSAIHPMEGADNGWWSAEVENAGPGTEYKLVLDGEPLPDPRSAFQPHGPNGPSCIVDHSSFEWSDCRWQARPLSSAIVYELHLGAFTPRGTFLSAIEKLDYLVTLGITHVELMPVCEFSGNWGWGYDGVDLFAPHHSYGTPDDLKRLVDACHANGLAVLLDVVYNHLGPSGNYLARFGPYFTGAYHTPWGEAVNLDGVGSHEVRRFFADNALMWLRDYHMDGLRLDAVHAFVDRSAVNFLEFLSSEVQALRAQVGRYLVLIAESDLNNPLIVTSREARGFGMDAQWSDDFHHALHTIITGERNGYYSDFGSYADLKKALQHVFIYDGRYSESRDRIHGRPVVGLSGNHFLGYAQTHDQIGNRAQGERLSQLVSIGKQKVAAAIVLTAPFVPMLFQGEEYGASTPFQYFTHHEDPELARQVSEGRRREFEAFGWDPEDIPDPQDPATFQRSKLNWNEINVEPHASMLSWTRRLIGLRKRSRDLTDGSLDRVEFDYNEAAQWMVIRRGSIEVAINLADDRQALPMRNMPDRIIASEDDFSLRPGLIELPAESVAIIDSFSGADQRSPAAHRKVRAAEDQTLRASSAGRSA
jgi:maltooligosyltrehalose trehalohydrolase